MIKKRDAYALPDIKQEFRRIGKDIPNYFCVIDLKGGFQQLTTLPDDHEKTAFNCNFTHMHFAQFLFVPTNERSLFQREIHDITRNLYFSVNMGCFMDDLYLWATIIDELRIYIRTLLTQLADRNVILRPNKCNGVMELVYLLRYQLDKDG